MQVGDFLCGLAAGWSQIISGQPFDIIKTKIQAGSTQPVFQIAKDILKQQGVKGFYKGSSSLFFGFAFTIGAEFLIYEFMKKTFFNWNHKANESDFYDIEKLGLAQIALSGGVVGAVISLIISPVQYAKVQSQLLKKQGSFMLLFRDLKSNGLKNISKGFSMTFIRETIGSMIYYGVYETMVRAITRNNRGNANSIHFMIAGALSGLAYWTAVYPIDTIKTNMQANKTFKESCNLMFDAKYKGFKVASVRSLLTNGLSFAVYEKCQKKRNELGNLYYSMY